MMNFGKGLLVLCLFFTFNSYAKLVLGSYNIRTYDSKKTKTNKSELKRILTQVNADLLTVEEIINANSFKSFIKKSFPQYGLYLSKCGGGGRQKIGFLYKKSTFKLVETYEDSRLSSPGSSVGQFGCGRLRPALIGIFNHIPSGEQFVAIGIHLKAGGSPNNYYKRAKQYKIVSQIVDELKLADYKNIVLMGDFNSTGFVAQDEDFDNFTQMLKESEFETSSKNIQCTSYWSGYDRRDNLEEPSVLDHILYPREVLGKKAKKVEIFSHCKRAACKVVSSKKLGRSYASVSDHCPVTVSFE